MAERSHNNTNEAWRQIRQQARARARRRMQHDLLVLSRIEERTGAIRVQVVNPETKHTRVIRRDNPEIWVDFYPTRGTVMLRYGQGRARKRGVSGVLMALGLDPAVLDELRREGEPEGAR